VVCFKGNCGTWLWQGRATVVRALVVLTSGQVEGTEGKDVG
jgi:hypothetical protein